jgi:hypothetical protein
VEEALAPAADSAFPRLAQSAPPEYRGGGKHQRVGQAGAQAAPTACSSDERDAGQRRIAGTSTAASGGVGGRVRSIRQRRSNCTRGAAADVTSRVEQVPRNLGGAMTPEQTAVCTYKDLDITFATGFSQALDYTDLIGLAGVRSVAFGRPQPVDPDGQGTFSALGDMLYGGYVNGTQVPTGVTVAMVRPHPGSDGSAVAPPVRYETLWGCLWKPVPPHGYVALGMLSALGLKAVQQRRTGPAVERRQWWLNFSMSAMRAPRSRGIGGARHRSHLTSAEHGNPVTVRWARTVIGRPTVRRADTCGGNRTAKKRTAAAERRQERTTRHRTLRHGGRHITGRIPRQMRGPERELT